MNKGNNGNGGGKKSTKTGNTAYTDLLLYPNPTYGSLNIESYASKTESATIEDMRGEQITQVELIPGKNTIDTQGWEPGVYLLKIGKKRHRIIVR